MYQASQNEDETPFVYNESLKTALKKTRIIEKRMAERKEVMKRRLLEFKNACRMIRFQELIPTPQQTDLPSLDSKAFIKSSSGSMVADQDDQSAKEENVKVSKTEVKLYRCQENRNQENTKMAKIQYQSLNQSSSQDGHQSAPTVIQTNSEVKREYEHERIDLSAIQRSDNSTPKFIDSEKESSFVLKSPYRGEDQSFLVQNHDFQRTKNTNSIQNTTGQRNLIHFNVETNQNLNEFAQFTPVTFLFGTQPLFKNQMFSFSNIPQTQMSNYESIPNGQISKVQEVPHYQAFTVENTQTEKENISDENLISVSEKLQNADPRVERSVQMQNDVNLLQSVDKSVAESGDDKSLSLNQIYEQLENFFKVSSSQDTPVKQPDVQSTNPPVKEASQVDLSKLEVNPNFAFSTVSTQKVVKSKNRLFKQKRNRKNSSEKDESE